MTVSKIPVPASELRISDLGRTVESIVYGSRRGKAKPSRHWDDTAKAWITKPHVYTIESIYVHQNGTILINQNGYKIYLRPDTEIFFHYEDTK
jgi:hypothetical protein